jgi:hypothetical protein
MGPRGVLKKWLQRWVVQLMLLDKTRKKFPFLFEELFIHVTRSSSSMHEKSLQDDVRVLYFVSVVKALAITKTDR